MHKIVIAGFSLSGLRAAQTLRAEGYQDQIVVVGRETHLPYDRPPLSKQLLTGEWPVEKLSLRTTSEIDDLGLDLMLGRSVAGLDMSAREVVLDGGETIGFDGLVIATGATPRSLPAASRAGDVFTLRTMEDALAISHALDEPGQRVVIVGAGFIGSEIAASAVARAGRVTVLEAEPWPLARSVGPVVGEVCAGLHVAGGVDLRLGVTVRGIDQTANGKRVVLADGDEVMADVVVVGIGVQPETTWLERSGLTAQTGVVCDAMCFAAPNVVAAGDVARWHHPAYQRLVRLEHWTNANDQAVVAARNLLAGPDAAEAYAPTPYVWSDQYGTRIQMAGDVSADDTLHVVSGSVEEGKLLALTGQEDLRAVVSVGKGRDFIKYRRLLNQGASFMDAVHLE